MPRRTCSGTMSGGTRPCYFKATNQVGSRWFCNKCMRARAQAQIRTTRPKKKPLKPLPRKDLIALHRHIMSSKRRRELDMSSAQELVFNIMPLLLKEIFHLRGLEEPEDV